MRRNYLSCTVLHSLDAHGRLCARLNGTGLRSRYSFLVITVCNQIAALVTKCNCSTGVCAAKPSEAPCSKLAQQHIHVTCHFCDRT